MKKSKFLKRSLSLLLAVLMLVAMVPSGAFAATPPTLMALYAGSESAPATISGRTVSVTIDPGNNLAAVPITYTATDGRGTLLFGDTNAPLGSNNVLRYMENGVATVPLKLVDPTDNTLFTDYTLVLQAEKVETSLQIKDFRLENQLFSTFEPGKLAFEVVMPYNTDLDGDVTPGDNEDIVAHIDLAAENASHDWGKSNSNGDTSKGSTPFPGLSTPDYNEDPAILVVTGPNGTDSVTYTITIRRATALEYFSLEGEVTNDLSGTTAIYRPGDPATTPAFTMEQVAHGGTIDIEIPRYALTSDPDFLKNIVPTFASEYDSRVQLYDGNTLVTELKSGEAADFSGSNLKVVVTYPAETNGAKAIYDLTITEENPSTEAYIEGFTVVNPSSQNMYQDGTVDGTELKATLNSAYKRDNVTLQFTVPYGAEVSLDGTSYVSGTVAPGRYSVVEILNVDVRNQLSVYVRSEETSPYTIKTYTLNVDLVNSVETAKFKSFVLKNKATGAEYAAETGENGLAGVYVKFKVPASTTADDLADFNMFYTAPAGAELRYTVSGGENNLPKSGSSLSGQVGGQTPAVPNPVLPNPQPNLISNVEVPYTTEIIVRTYGANGTKYDETKYIVQFELNDFLKGNTINTGDFALTSARVVSEINSDTVYTATKGSALRSGVSVATLNIEIPRIDFGNVLGKNPDPMENLNIGALNLPEGAALYIENPNQTANPNQADRYHAADSGKWSLNDLIDIVNGTGDWGYYDDIDTTARVFVVNEKGIMDHTRNNKETLNTATAAADLGNVSVYYLLITEAAPREKVELKSISLIDENDKEIVGTIANGKISFDVPYSWANAFKGVVGTPRYGKPLYFKYDAAPGNYLMGNPATYANGGFRTVSGEQESLANGNDAFMITPAGLGLTLVDTEVVASDVRELQLRSEGTTVVTYPVTFNVLPVNTGAELKSFSLNSSNGTINDNKVSVVMPYKSNLSSLIASFTLSDWATMTFDETNVEMISGKGPALNYEGTVNVTVTSEDGNYTKKYAINVTTPLTFSDVQDTSQWYYTWVYKAAELGLVAGYPDGTFKPLNSVTRGDFAVFVARAVSGMTDEELKAEYTEDPFLDVSIDQYYAAAVAWAADKGYVNGYDNSTFKPTQTITRQEVAAVWFRVLELTEVTNPTNKFADDHLISNWAKGMVYACAQNGIMQGKENNLFAPLKPLTRAETAKVTADYVENKK